MKKNEMITVNTNAVVKTKPRTDALNKNHYVNINNDVDHCWQMYHAQLQRNGELMTIIDRQQQFIQKAINKGILNSIMPDTLQPPIPQVSQVIHLPEFKDMSMDKFTVSVLLFKQLFPNRIKRFDGIQCIIKILYTLHQMGGASFPMQLFEKTGIAASTGFRNAMFLQNTYLIKKVGGKYNTMYKITHWGKQLLDGTLKNNYCDLVELYPTPEEGRQEWEHYWKLKI